MKKSNSKLSYILVGAVIIGIIIIMTCGETNKTEVHIMPEEVLSFPNPEEVKQEVKEKVEEVQEAVTTKVEEIKEEIEETKELLEEIIPHLELPVEIPAVIEPIEEIPIEETPIDSTKTSEINQEGVE